MTRTLLLLAAALACIPAAAKILRSEQGRAALYEYAWVPLPATNEGHLHYQEQWWKAAHARFGLPDDGTLIRITDRYGDTYSGPVTLVWRNLDTVCIDIDAGGVTRHCYPELGDKWRLHHWECIT